MDGFQTLYYVATLDDSDRWQCHMWSQLVNSTMFKFTNIVGLMDSEVQRHVGDLQGIATPVLYAKFLWANVTLM
jgi:hypothetical protein